ncbi:MAG: pyridoxamine 5'-phosphate oxidase family protein [Candidatus Thorarchaeota archaeon]|jgi:nitroimidazol reductase NimA-like FMN-containing flavoprotein (pyridoxamine 5'-phosphate oxidase superfamily)
MRGIRRKEKAIESVDEIKHILATTQYVTVSMCQDNEPYLVTLSHGYDREKHCIYFHCAQEGKKIDILKKNPSVWGQAIVDHGYAEGKCDHLYATAQFQGNVTFVTDFVEKKYALTVMVNQLEPVPSVVIEEQFKETSIQKVNIGRIDISFMSGKRAKDVIISL